LVSSGQLLDVFVGWRHLIVGVEIARQSCEPERRIRARTGYGKVPEPTAESRKPAALTKAPNVWLRVLSGIETDHEPAEKLPPSTDHDGVAPPG
jgi:hypothetical protein